MRCPRGVHLLFETLSHMCLVQDGISYVKAYACHWSQMQITYAWKWNICESFCLSKINEHNCVLVLFWVYKQMNRVNCRNRSCKAVKRSCCKLWCFLSALLSEAHTHSPLRHGSTYLLGVGVSAGSPTNRSFSSEFLFSTVQEGNNLKLTSGNTHISAK